MCADLPIQTSLESASMEYASEYMHNSKNHLDSVCFI